MVDQPEGSLDDVVAALRYIDEMVDPPDIVNMSLVQKKRSKELEKVLNSLSLKTILIAPAGKSHLP